MTNVGFYMNLNKFENIENGEYDFATIKERLFTTYKENEKIYGILQDIFNNEPVQMVLGKNPYEMKVIEYSEGKITEIKSTGTPKTDKYGGQTAILVSFKY